MVIEHGQGDAAVALQGIDKGGDRPVADPLDLPLGAVDRDRRSDAPLARARLGQQAVIDQADAVAAEIGVLEQGPDHLAGDFLAGAVGDLLDDLAELDLQAARQVEPVIGLQDIGDAALARLAVDPDHRLVAAAEILRVDRQVGHLPEIVVALFLRFESLLDRILMRAGEGREHQLAGIGMARMHRQLGAVLGGTHHLVDIGDDQTRIDALAEQVQGQRDDVDIAGALAIAEQGALDPVGAGHDRKLGRRHRGAAVVVRMQAQDQAVAVAHLAGEPFDLVGIDIGRRHLDRARQVDDHLLVRRRPPDIHHRLADLDREIELGAAEALGRILIDDLGLRHLRCELADLPRARHRDVDDARPVEPKDDAALQFRGRVVEMHDRALGAADRLEGLVDQLGARLGQHLDRDVLGNQAVLDDLAHKGEIGVRGRREADLDLLEAEL